MLGEYEIQMYKVIEKIALFSSERVFLELKFSLSFKKAC